MKELLQYRITTILVDCMVLSFSASALSLYLQQFMDQIKEEGGLASERKLLKQLNLNSSFLEVVSSTDLGHTIIILAGNLALQTIYYFYFRWLLQQLEEHERAASLTSQMTVE